MDFFGSFLSVVMHVAVAVFLLAYLPVRLVWRVVRWMLVRPFSEEDMKGKVVLITGASSGIGEHVAYQYAMRGASLVLVARRENALQSVAKTAIEHGAPDVLVKPADISIPNESKRIIEETIAHFGQLNHLVVNAGIWSTCLFEDVTNISAFKQVMDVNFWGSVYPTYHAIPHLKSSHGNIIVTASIAGYVPTARMSFYNASKAAIIRFFETLRSELGSEIRITIITPGYVESELTKGKVVKKDGEVGIDREARDVQLGPIPIGRTKKCAEIIVDGACKGDEYVTWPSWFKPFYVVMCLAPEVVNWFSHTFYVAKPGATSTETLSKRILEASGVNKFFYPASIRSPVIKI